MNTNALLRVNKTRPANRESDIPTDQVVTIQFNHDLNIDSLTGHIYVTNPGGVVVPISIVYQDRLLEIVPASGNWTSSEDHQVTIVGDDILNPAQGFRGIMSVLGYPMAGSFIFAFRTAANLALPAPGKEGILPVYQSVVSNSSVTLVWPVVTDASRYEVELSSFVLMEPMLWSGSVITTTVTPEVNLLEETYYWRVRAVDEENNPGDWSEVFIFGVSLYPDNPVSPEDELTILPDEIIAYPEEDWANVSLNLKRMTAVVPGLITQEMLDLGSIVITKQDALNSEAELITIEPDKYSAEAIVQPDGSTLIVITLSEVI